MIRQSILVVVVLIICSGVSQATVVMDWVLVGDAGNAYDTHGSGYGGVSYVYQIGKYEVTNEQYIDFLNAVATTDTYGLYNTEMVSGWNNIGGIARSGTPGNYTYSARSGRAKHPVNYVSYWDSCRFANWLHNGQPTGLQDSSTTERGAYTLDGYNGTQGGNITRNPDAKVFVTSEDEWYKAAYYKGGSLDAGYWDWPTQSDTPTVSEAPPGTSPSGSANAYDNGYAVGAPDYTTEVGAYNAVTSVSPYGTFDQGGNVIEWLEEVYWSPSGVHGRYSRGGSFMSGEGGIWELKANHRGSGWPTTETWCIGFRVAAVPEPSTFLLLDPNGGESLTSGKAYPIKWSSTGSISEVLIEYSVDNGSSWTAVSPPNVGNNGLYNWLVPSVNSNQCIVRISDVSDPNISDTSDDVFRIRTPMVVGCFQGLGDLPGGEFHSNATSVSADGSTVVGKGASASGYEAFRWTSGDGMVGLGDLSGGSFYSHAEGISADGLTIVGQSHSASGYEAFRWTSSDGMVGLGDLSGGSFDSVAHDVSADGSIVVGMGNLGNEAFIWDITNGILNLKEVLVNSGLNLTGWTLIAARGISDDGLTIVGYGTNPSGNIEAWIATIQTPMAGASFQGLGDLSGGSFHSVARGVSADGSTVVGWSNSASGDEAFRWTSSGGMVGLGDLSGGSFWSEAVGVSMDGSTVVGLGKSTADNWEAFRWTSVDGMVGLGGLYGASNGSVGRDVSADGSIVVGRGNSSQGFEAFRWTSGCTIGGYIDWIDLGLFFSWWLDEGCSEANDWCGRADINRSTVVDSVDYSWLAKYWASIAPKPNSAGNPEPQDAATEVSITSDLSWTAGADTAAHGIYFGISPTIDANDFQGYQTGAIFNPGTMTADTTYYWQVDEVGLGGETAGNVWSFTTAPVPGKAYNPSPSDSATHVNINHNLSWTANFYTTSQDVYFGTNPTPGAGEFDGNQTSTTFDPGTLDYDTTYYWRIDGVGPGGTTTGVIWSFTTEAPPVPGQAGNPIPANTATDVNITTCLNWTAGVNTQSHDVYFGTNPILDINDLQGNQTETTFCPPYSLEYNTTYYWRINEKNPYNTTTGEVWSFTTMVDPNLVGWWKFDETSGVIAYDSSGDENHGQLVDGIGNGLVWAPTEGALNFDGSNNLNRVVVSTVGMSTTEGTIAIWANLAEPQNRGDGRNGSGYFFGCDNGVKDRILLYMDNSNTQLDVRIGDHSETNIITLGTLVWYHIALSWNSGSYVVHLNGSEIAAGTYGGLTTLPSTADIGNNGGSYKQSFHGLMGDVQVYDKSLSTAEIQELYQDVAN